MNLKTAAVSLLAIFVSISAFCQKGYKKGFVITNENDTVQGLVQVRTNFQNHKLCVFINNGETEPMNIKPGEIKAYRIENSKYYVSKEIEIDSTKKTVFLEYLMHGIVNLYYFKDIINQYFFIEKDGKMILLSNDRSEVVKKGKGPMGEYETRYYVFSNQYIRVLQYLFQDCPSLANEIKTTGFDYKPLLRVTKDYHNLVCKDQQCIDFTRTTRKGMFVEPYAGLINSWMGLRTSKDKVHQQKPYGGFRIRFKPFKGYNNFDLLAGVNYSSNEFQGDYENSLNAYDLPYRIYVKYNIIRVPITVEYTIPLKKIQPFVSAGYENIFLTSPSYSVYRMHLNQLFEEDTKFRSYQAGFIAGVGVKYLFSPGAYIFLKNEVEYRIPVAKFGWVLDNQRITSDMLSFGIGFKIR